MLKNFKILECDISIKVPFLHSHLDYSPKNLGAVIKKQGGRIHQYMKEMEKRYQGKWNTSLIADYCWIFKKDDPFKVHKKKKSKVSRERKNVTRRACNILHMLIFI